MRSLWLPPRLFRIIRASLTRSLHECFKKSVKLGSSIPRGVQLDSPGQLGSLDYRSLDVRRWNCNDVADSSIRPRDIFDIAAAAEQYADPIVTELRSYRTEVTRALEALESLNPEFVNNAISQLLIRQEFAAVAKTAIKRTKQILQAV